MILVDSNDNEIGTEEKIKAHREGKLHRCFSIFVFNSKNELLIQQRAKIKYHCGGLWANTCCSHPRKNEEINDAVHRRLKEELGFDTKLKEVFTFTYNLKFDNGLTENEFNHVFIGRYDQDKVDANPEEIENWKWIKIDDLQEDIKENPEKYAGWFKLVLDRVLESRKQ